MSLYTMFFCGPLRYNSIYLLLVVPTTCPEGCQDGQKGLRGDDGLTGPRGYPGNPGPPGYGGPRGPRGIAGLPGDLGDEGFAGSPGHRGPRGHRGLPGAPGPAGLQGPPGPSDNCPEFDGVDFDVVSNLCVTIIIIFYIHSFLILFYLYISFSDPHQKN